MRTPRASMIMKETLKNGEIRYEKQSENEKTMKILLIAKNGLPINSAMGHGLCPTITRKRYASQCGSIR